MLAAASLQLHRPAAPLQRARAPSGAAMWRRPHARWAAMLHHLIRRLEASLLHSKSDYGRELLVCFHCRLQAYRVAATAA